MPSTRENVAIVAGALAVYAALTLLIGAAPLAERQPDAVAHAAVVTARDLSQGSVDTRFVIGLPIAAALPYVVTGDLIGSFALVNSVAFALLVLGACLILDKTNRRLKVAVAATLLILAAPTREALSFPVQAGLVGVSLTTFAIALCGRVAPMWLIPVHGAAVLTSPAGIGAPLYGIWWAWRAGRRAAVVAALIPAVILWAGWMFLARGGSAGVAEWLSIERIGGDIDLWSTPLFVLFATYFLATSMGGFSALALGFPRALIDTVRRSPEVIAAIAPALLYVLGGELAVAHRMAALIPVWLLLLASSRLPHAPWTQTRFIVVAMVLSALTQWPVAGTDATSWLAELQPYALFSGRAGADGDAFRALWWRRFVFLAVPVLAFVVIDRVHAWRRTRGHLTNDGQRPTVVSRASPSWPRVAYATAVVMASLVSVGLLGIPVQLSDALVNLIDVEDGTFLHAITKDLNGSPYLRPLLWGTLDLTAALAGDHRYLVFRGLHVVELVVLLLLVVRALRVRDMADAAVVPLCLAVVVGMHTAAGTLIEAFPINTFLTILVCCAAAVNLLQAQPRPLVDVASVFLLTFAMFTVETGLLVWVIIAAGWLAGWRGVSRRGVMATTLCVAGYFILRFAIFEGGTPSVNERSSGFGFAMADPIELQHTFGSSVWMLYLYNVASALSTVLFAEPRGAVFAFVRDATRGTVEPWQVLNVLVSTMTTAALVAYVMARAGRWVRGRVEERERLVVLFLAVWVANATFAYAYVKDVVLSPAGLFYAMAVFVVIRDLGRVSLSLPRQLAPLLTVAVVVVACGWSVKFAGINYSLRQAAVATRDEWAYYEDWERKQPLPLQRESHLALKNAMLDDAARRASWPPAWSASWADRLFDVTQRAVSRRSLGRRSRSRVRGCWLSCCPSSWAWQRWPCS